jgi:hypothetical protein
MAMGHIPPHGTGLDNHRDGSGDRHPGPTAWGNLFMTKKHRVRHSGIPTSDWICDDEARDRIIRAVGDRCPCTNPNQLVFDLNAAHSILHTRVILDSGKGARLRRELFSGIVDSAEIFKQKLLDERGDHYAARNIFHGEPPRKAFEDKLNWVIDRAKELQCQNSQAWLRLKRPPKEWFAGEILPKIFESNFGRVAGTSTNPKTSKVSGPFIKFAVTVMREMGMQIAPGTIGRILKDLRSNRARRM